MIKEVRDFNEAMTEEVVRAISGFGNLKPGSEEQEKCGRSIKALSDALLNGLELESKMTDSEINYELELKKLDLEKDKLKIENGGQNKQANSQLTSDILAVTFGMIQWIGGMAFYNALYNKGLKFEETGTIASSPVKQITQRFTDFVKIKK